MYGCCEFSLTLITIFITFTDRTIADFSIRVPLANIPDQQTKRSIEQTTRVEVSKLDYLFK